MNPGPMAEALTPLRERMSRAVQEREILRVFAASRSDDPAAAMIMARRESLVWARKHSGGRLPKAAWDGQSFEYLAGGRTTLGVCMAGKDFELWGLRTDDPDKSVAGRVWTTEVTLGLHGDSALQVGVRQIVNSPEQELAISPHVPGLVQQIATSCGLHAGAFPVNEVPWRVESDEDIEKLIGMLVSRERRLPMLVATGDERAVDPSSPLIDVNALARATLGISHVVVLPAPQTYALSDAFGKVRSVYHGAIRVYLPGFDAASDPYQHCLVLSDAIKRDAESCVSVLRSFVANESLRRTRLGKDVIPFVVLRSAAFRIEQQRQIDEGASEADELKTALKRIEALEAEVDAASNQADQSFDLAMAEEDRAKAAESQLNAARARIRMLERQLNERGHRPDEDEVIPENWDGFADWCDQVLVGRLVLAPAAHRGVRKPVFQDAVLVGRCLLWLASTCRDRRIEGGGSLANIPIESGVENAPCGKDVFEFDFQGRRLMADWHVKNGGNTRYPTRCLRIYYAFDEATQQIIIADMPAHRRSGAS